MFAKTNDAFIRESDFACMESVQFGYHTFCKGGSLSMNREQVICPCLDVTAGQIMDAYEEGATTVDAIKEITGAGSVCGARIDEIATALNELKG